MNGKRTRRARTIQPPEIFEERFRVLSEFVGSVQWVVVVAVATIVAIATIAVVAAIGGTFGVGVVDVDVYGGGGNQSQGKYKTANVSILRGGKDGGGSGKYGVGKHVRQIKHSEKQESFAV